MVEIEQVQVRHEMDLIIEYDEMVEIEQIDEMLFMPICIEHRKQYL